MIYKACSNPKVRRALFSATFAVEVEEWCKEHLDHLAEVSIGARNAATRAIDQHLVFVGNEEGKIPALRKIFREVSYCALFFPVFFAIYGCYVN